MLVPSQACQSLLALNPGLCIPATNPRPTSRETIYARQVNIWILGLEYPVPEGRAARAVETVDRKVLEIRGHHAKQSAWRPSIFFIEQLVQTVRVSNRRNSVVFGVLAENAHPAPWNSAQCKFPSIQSSKSSPQLDLFPFDRLDD